MFFVHIMVNTLGGFNLNVLVHNNCLLRYLVIFLWTYFNFAKLSSLHSKFLYFHRRFEQRIVNCKISPGNMTCLILINPKSTSVPVFVHVIWAKFNISCIFLSILLQYCCICVMHLSSICLGNLSKQLAIAISGVTPPLSNIPTIHMHCNVGPTCMRCKCSHPAWLNEKSLGARNWTTHIDWLLCDGCNTFDSHLSVSAIFYGQFFNVLRNNFSWEYTFDFRNGVG